MYKYVCVCVYVCMCFVLFSLFCVKMQEFACILFEVWTIKLRSFFIYFMEMRVLKGFLDTKFLWMQLNIFYEIPLNESFASIHMNCDHVSTWGVLCCVKKKFSWIILTRDLNGNLNIYLGKKVSLSLVTRIIRKIVWYISN